MTNELPLVQIWALFTVFCFLKFASDTAIQAVIKFRTNDWAYPEDQKMASGENKPVQKGTLAQKRSEGLWRNDLENVLPFAIISLGAALTQAASASTYSIIIAVFCVARVLHAFFMMKGLQPFRNLSYQLGNLAQLAFVILIVMRFFSVGA